MFCEGLFTKRTGRHQDLRLISKEVFQIIFCDLVFLNPTKGQKPETASATEGFVILLLNIDQVGHFPEQLPRFLIYAASPSKFTGIMVCYPLEIGLDRYHSFFDNFQDILGMVHYFQVQLIVFFKHAQADRA